MHIGLICPDVPGHLNPMTTLGRELQRRGHRVTLIAPPDAREKAEASRLNFASIGEAELPPGSRAAHNAELGQLSGRAALRFTIAKLLMATELILRDGPKVVRQEGIEALLVDQVCPAGGSVADHASLPFVTVCNAIALNAEADVPSPILPWNYWPTPLGRLRNEIGRRAIARLTAPIVVAHNRQRAQWRLPPVDATGGYDSPCATITQQPAFFDFPRRALSSVFHYTGPFLDESSQGAIEFPWERLNPAKPLIYASLGTLQNRLHYIFRIMAEACDDLGAQIVISYGSRDQKIPDDLPGDTLAVPFAPQSQLIPKARMILTHCGLNTTLEALHNGVPAVAIPIASEQPGIAARLAYLGMGEVVPLKKLNTENLRSAVHRVWKGEHYRERAQWAAQEMAVCDGLGRAVDIAEQAFTTRRPVLRDRAM